MKDDKKGYVTITKESFDNSGNNSPLIYGKQIEIRPSMTTEELIEDVKKFFKLKETPNE